MKLFDAVGKEHEEFKLRLKKDLDVVLNGGERVGIFPPVGGG